MLESVGFFVFFAFLHNKIIISLKKIQENVHYIYFSQSYVIPLFKKNNVIQWVEYVILDSSQHEYKHIVNLNNNFNKKSTKMY